MKLILGLSLLFTSNVFAMNICSFEDLYSVQETLEQKNIKPYKTSADHKKFTSVEKQLIHTTVSLQEWRGKMTVNEAVEVFMDLDEKGNVGSLAGEIRYYVIDGKKVTELLYFPGDNDYGAFYSENNVLIASVEDAEIVCSPSKK